MIDAIVYTRFSPRKNADESESCEVQTAHCEQYANDHDMEIREIFLDKAISGSEVDRPILWAAIDALKRDSTLLVYKYDRLARDVYLSECIKREIGKIGGRIVAVQGGIEGDGPEHVLVRQVLACMAEYERKIIGIRTKHALRHYQRSGRRVGRHPPYGMKLDPVTLADDEVKTLIIPEESEQPAVSMIMLLHQRGCSLHEIVMYMNKEMLSFARGKKGWYQRAVEGVIDRVS